MKSRPSSRHFSLPFAHKVRMNGWIFVILSWIIVGGFAADLRSAESWVALGARGGTPASLHGIKDIAMNGTSAIALMEDGNVVAWGYASQFANMPPGLADVVSVSVGTAEFFAVRADGTLLSWGADFISESARPKDLPKVVKCVGGGNHTVCLTESGTVIAWGDNSGGQTDVPKDLHDVIDIAAGFLFSVALKRDGTVVTWGSLPGNLSVPDDVRDVVAIAEGDFYVVALRRDGTVAVWGDEFMVKSHPVPVGLSGVVKIAAGYGQAMALTKDGDLVLWGNLNEVRGDCRDAIKIASGGSITQILHADGSLTAFGYDTDGIMLPPKGIADVKEIFPGAAFALAERQDGSLFGWGVELLGDLDFPKDITSPRSVARGLAVKGDGALVSWGYYNPMPPASVAHGIDVVKTGWDRALALKSDGSVVQWSLIGTEISLPELGEVAAIDAEGYHAMALKRDGTVVSWGESVYGESVTAPGGLSGVVAVAADFSRFYALKSDGRVVAWGYQIEENQSIDLGLTNIVALEAMDNGIVALRADHTVVAWPEGYYSRQRIPSGLSGVSKIVAGGTDAWALAAAMPSNDLSITDAIVKYDGKPHGLAITRANGSTPTTTTYNGLYTRPVDPGVYEVVAEADYLGSYGRAVGRLVITDPSPVAQSISFTAINSLRYGDAPITLQATSTANLPVSLRVVSGPAVLAGASLMITGVGTVVVAAEQAGDLHVVPADTVQQSVTVLPAILTVIAENASRRVGAPNPVFSGTISGVVQGDDITAVFVSTASITTPIGVYGPTSPEGITPAIIDRLGRLGNYSVQTTNGTLAITAEGQSIAFASLGSPRYGEGHLFLQAPATSGLPVQFRVVSGPASIAGNVLSLSGAGTVTIAADQAGDAQFAAAHAEQTITVLPALLSIVATDTTRMVGAPNPSFVGVLTGVVSGDGITGSYTSAATESTPPGVFGPDTPESIVPTLRDPNHRLANYTVTTTRGTLTILAPATDSTTPANGGGGGCSAGGTAAVLLGAFGLLAWRRRGVRAA